LLSLGDSLLEIGIEPSSLYDHFTYTNLFMELYF